MTGSRFRDPIASLAGLSLVVTRPVVARLVVAAALGWGVFAVTAKSETPLAEAAGPTLATISFFGQQFEASDFVFCLDTSASMGWSNSDAVQTSETISALSQLTPNQSFAIVTHGDEPKVFASTLLPATPANVLAAESFLNGIVPAGNSCMLEGLLETLPLVEQSAGAPLIIFAADGVPNCISPEATLAGWVTGNTIGADLATVALPFFANGELQIFTALLQLANDDAQGAVEFLRGDANGDGFVDIADPIFILRSGFGLICEPFCKSAADASGDSTLEPISDAVTIIAGLFVSGSPPIPPPFPSCGANPSNRLSCFGGSCP